MACSITCTWENDYVLSLVNIVLQTALQLQFGANYPILSQGRRDFKKKFLQALAKVRLVYPITQLNADLYNFILKPKLWTACYFASAERHNNWIGSVILVISENTPANPSIAYRFHVLTCDGCILCLAAISETALSPRRALSETVALNLSEEFRLVVICASNR